MDISKFWSRKAYSVIEDDEASQTSHVSSRTRNNSSYYIYILLVLLVTLSPIVGFFLGQQHSPRTPPLHNVLPFPAPPGLTRTAFHYNLTFSRAPSPLTNAAWDALMPSGRGLVRHPTLSPDVSVPAVFHQLHCLDSLRKAYYAALDHGGQEVSPTVGSREHVAGDRRSGTSPMHSDHLRPAHVRHCFDLLRQALMCAADTNLEPLDEALGGVTGWGSERMCRDYDAVKKWAEEWKALPPAP